MAGAVIYSRVSTKVLTENLSQPTQLRPSEEYCRREGVDVRARCQEECESAQTADRTELHERLTFCRTNKDRVHFVGVFTLTQFSRHELLSRRLGSEIAPARARSDDRVHTETARLAKDGLI
jgi:hypothetical protein